MVTTNELNNIKKALVDYISTRELDDGDELCLESQEMILKWIEVYFDDVVFEMENTAPRDTTLVGNPPKELASLRAEIERLKAENAALRELVVDGYYEEFGDVQSEGAKKEVDRFWRKSRTKQRLEQIEKGDG